VDVPGEDNFQYLIQATLNILKAQEIADSFPQTAANYSKEIDSLKSRFRQEELLTDLCKRTVDLSSQECYIHEG